MGRCLYRGRQAQNACRLQSSNLGFINLIIVNALFLTAEELQALTGYAVRVKQIEQLRNMGVPFRINGCGRAVVTRLAVEGGVQAVAQPTSWQPAVLHNFKKVA